MEKKDISAELLNEKTKKNPIKILIEKYKKDIEKEKLHGVNSGKIVEINESGNFIC